MNIPYGISNFADIIQSNCYYVDKTKYIPLLESQRYGRKYSLFLRPRRFGKSLFLSMLEYYYDIKRKDQFEELFGNLYIGKNPTSERNQYMILSFDFSSVDTGSGFSTLLKSFSETVYYRATAFLAKYADILSIEYREDLLSYSDQPVSILKQLFRWLANKPYKVYLLIDEYDNFANDLIASGNKKFYTDILHGGGFVRTFYKEIKNATKEGIVPRIFMTGVSPLVLNDLTSGFNNAKNISNAADLNEMLGFTSADVETMLDHYYTTSGSKNITVSKEKLAEDLSRYYDGYLFNEDDDERLYNSDMTLYFLSEMTVNGKYPKTILDLNARTDYKKLQHLIRLDTKTIGKHSDTNISQLNQIIKDGEIKAELIVDFPLESLAEQKYFVSFLYYLGLLTIDKYYHGKLLFKIPNYVIHTLYWDYLKQIIADATQIVINTSKLEDAIERMAYQGDIKPFIEFVHQHVIRELSNRDFIRFDEKYIKAILLTYLSMLDLYIPISEIEMNSGYADIVLMVDPKNPDVPYSYITELKYIKKQDATPKLIQSKTEEAIAQVKRYRSDKKITRLMQNTTIKTAVFVFIGADEVRIVEDVC